MSGRKWATHHLSIEILRYRKVGLLCGGLMLKAYVPTLIYPDTHTHNGENGWQDRLKNLPL